MKNFSLILLSAAIILISCISTKNKSTSPSTPGNEMVTFKGPIVFMMGSPETEIYRTPDELQHEVKITRSFAISKKEVTIA